MLFSKQTKRSELKSSDSPGPGSYAPRQQEGRASVIAFDKQVIGCDRNEALKCPDGPLPPSTYVSPPKLPRDKSSTGANAERKYTWATEKIHSLTSQLEAVNAQLKEHDRLTSELESNHRAVVSDLQSRLDQVEAARKITAEQLLSSIKETADLAAAVGDLKRRLAGSESEIAAEKIKHQASEEKLSSDAADLRRKDSIQAEKMIKDMKAQMEQTIKGLTDRLASKVASRKTELESVLESGRRDREDLLVKVDAQLAAKKHEINSLHHKLSSVESELCEVKALFIEADKRSHNLDAEIQRLGRVASEAAADLVSEREKSTGVLAAKEHLHLKLLESQSVQDRMRTEGARLIAVEAELKSKLQASVERSSQVNQDNLQKSDEINKLRSVISHQEIQIRDLEQKASHGFEAKAHSLSAALDKANERAYRAEKAAVAAEAAVLESRRLHDENESLSVSVAKLNHDLNEINNSLAIGHNNNKQKIQYHLRLKQELEEMRTELTILLKDKFLLEQAVRYLSTTKGGASISASACLVPTTLFTTPIAQKTMRLGARGKGCDQGTIYADSSKEDIERSIESAKKRTADEVATAGKGFSSPHEVSPNSDMTAIQSRIMAKIAQVLAPPTKAHLAPGYAEPRDQLPVQKTSQAKFGGGSVEIPSGRRGSVFR